MKKSSPFLRALRPTLIFIGLFVLLAILFGDKGTLFSVALGLPWSYIFESALDFGYSKTTLLFPFDLGVWINAMVIYLFSVWVYTQRVGS